MATTKKKSNDRILLWIVVLLIVFWLFTRKNKAAASTTVATTEPANNFSSSSYSSSNYSSVPTSTSEIESAITNLTGVAAMGKKWGINTNSGQVFYVDTAGNWQPYDASVSSNSAITGTYAAIHLDNSQSFTSDVTIVGVLLANHYNLTVLTDLEGFGGIEVLMNVVANNKVRVTARNNTGNTISLPELTISALQLN